MTPARRWLPFLLLPLLFCQSSAHACLWDSDTLAHEAQGMPDVMQVITGRFERNPPLYYQMRLARVTQELKAHPSLLADYDDAGVACDRLANDSQALAWMERKRQQLVIANAADPAVKDQWYRFYANRGTFRVHRWLRAGADRHRIAEVKAARDDIAHALQLNPNAHFGREKYQLQVLNWIIRPTSEYADKQAQEAQLRQLSDGIIGRIRGSGTDPYLDVRHQPDHIANYDDAALEQRWEGSRGDSVGVMQAKEQALTRLDPQQKIQRNQWYSCYVNLGTFQALDANVIQDSTQRITLLKSARANLVQAVKLMPKHDGSRAERQLHIIDKLMRPATADFDSRWDTAIPLSDYLSFSENDTSAIKGICGLIVLGDAWQSVDMFHALSKVLWMSLWKQNLSYMADLRCAELIDQGHGSLAPGTPKGNALKSQLELFMEQVHQEEEFKRLYPKLRAEAEAWQKQRTEFMMTRLKAGRHPDTDPTFWNDYHPAAPPSLAMKPFLTPQQAWNNTVAWGTGALIAGLGLLCLMVLRRFLRHRRIASPSAQK